MQNLESIVGLNQSGAGDIHAEFVVEGDAMADWRVRQFETKPVEKLSGLYVYEVKVARSSWLAADREVLGKNATLRWGRGGAGVRTVQGIIGSVEVGEGTSLDMVMTVRVVPALWASGHMSDSRIFSDKTAVEVAVEVLRADLQRFERTLKLRDLDPAGFPVRDYIVQHRETNLAFASRLLAEEGVWFHFDHPENDLEPEELVLGDHNQDLEEFHMGALHLDSETGTSPEVEFVTDLTRRRRVGPNKLLVRQYNWGNPDVQDEEEHAPESEGLELALYEHGDVPRESGETPTHTPAPQAQRRLERSLAEANSVTMSSTYAAARAGTTFVILGHSDPDLDGEYLVTSVSHRYEAEGAEEAITQRRGEYANRVTAIPLDNPWRPPRIDKPRIWGVQTALVVDASGATDTSSDVVTDAHGRVRVKLPWDRTKQGDEVGHTTSCWLRVAQMWAGAGWGTQFIPRIGMEVIVTFVDGDPDQPLVTGTIYNGRHGIPFEPSQSGVLTSSVPDDSGYNQWMFEDAAGSERIYVHGQKDYVVDVKNDRTTHIYNDEAHTVDNDRTRLVGGAEKVQVAKDKKEEIGGNLVEVVQGDQSVTVVGQLDETVLSSMSLSVIGNRIETVGPLSSESIGGAKFIKADGAIEMVGGANVGLTGGTISQVSGGTSTEKVAKAKTVSCKGYSATSSAAYSQESKEDMSLKTGKTLKMDAKEDVVLNGGKKATFVIKKELVIKAGKATITLKENGDIILDGNKIQLKGKGDVTLKGTKTVMQ